MYWSISIYWRSEWILKLSMVPFKWDKRGARPSPKTGSSHRFCSFASFWFFYLPSCLNLAIHLLGHPSQSANALKETQQQQQKANIPWKKRYRYVASLISIFLLIVIIWINNWFVIAISHIKTLNEVFLSKIERF